MNKLLYGNGQCYCYITNGVDYVMEKFGRYVLQMEFTMLEVYIRRKGKHQIRR